MSDTDPSWRPPAGIVRVAAYAACFLVVAAALWVLVRVMGLLALVLFPLVVATFLTRVLSVPANRLRARGWRPAPVATTVVVGFLVLLVGVGALIAGPLVSEFRTLGPTVSKGVADVEDWLVEDSPFDITRADIQRFKDDFNERLGESGKDTQGQVVAGARIALEVLAEAILALVLTFFAIKDGAQFQQWALGLVPRRHRDNAVRVSAAGWATLGGYLRGASLLGVFEGLVIGVTMAVTGAGLVLPVMLLTFCAAFVPLVGAWVAGLMAVLVALATGGLTSALVVAGVAFVVQQFDNELLAPWIYGKALSLHPVVILLALAAGTASFGIVGTLLAVPLVAIVVAGVDAVRQGEPVGADRLRSAD